MSLLKQLPRLMGALALVLAFAFVACESDAQHIRATNEAAKPEAVENPVSAKIDTIDIQDGDCINSTLPEDVSIESVVIVPCSGAWHYRVLNSFTVNGYSRYPGDDFFDQQTYERCDRRYTYALVPSAEFWELRILGDRKVSCLQDSFGLSITDPAKLDSLVAPNSLTTGECFNEAPEAENLLIELVDCSGAWEFQVANIFSVPEDLAYPSERYLKLQAEQKCDRPWDIYYQPNAETWDLGHRHVTCVRIFESAAIVAAVPSPTSQPTETLRRIQATAVPTATATPGPTTMPTATLEPPPTLVPTATLRPTATPGPSPTPTPATPTLASMHNTQNARWVKWEHPELHQAITDLPWVKDGLDNHEKEAIDSILYAAVVDPSLADDMIKLPWVKDGPDAEEKESIEGLTFIAFKDLSVAQALTDMPFMRSHEPADFHALDSIREIVRDGLTATLTSSRIYRNGITDKWAPVVAAAGATGSVSAINEYLNALAITVETGQYATAVQPLIITIVRLKSSPAQAGTMETAHQAVAGAEAVMQLPLPTRHVIIVFDPRAVSFDYFGTNHKYAIGIKKENLEGGTASLRNMLYHEVAHYWWRGNVNWIDEGMADTVAATASLAIGDKLEARPNRRKECTTQNISALGQTEQGGEQFHCNYYLGEKLFRGVQDQMPPGEFTTAIQALYFASQAKPRPQSQNEYRAGIEEVRQAFPGQGKIIEVHYTGDLNAPRRWDPDDAISLLHHDAVIWTRKPTYHNSAVSFSGRLTGEATLVARSIAEAQQGGSSSPFTIGEGQQSLGSILTRLTDGSYWTLDDPADVVADQFEIDGTSFNVSLRWPTAAGNPTGKHITIWGYNNSSRVSVFGGRADALGISLIR